MDTFLNLPPQLAVPANQSQSEIDEFFRILRENDSFNKRFWKNVSAVPANQSQSEIDEFFRILRENDSFNKRFWKIDPPPSINMPPFFGGTSIPSAPSNVSAKDSQQQGSTGTNGGGSGGAPVNKAPTPVDPSPFDFGIPQPYKITPEAYSRIFEQATPRYTHSVPHRADNGGVAEIPILYAPDTVQTTEDLQEYLKQIRPYYIVRIGTASRLMGAGDDLASIERQITHLQNIERAIIHEFEHRHVAKQLHDQIASGKDLTPEQIEQAKKLGIIDQNGKLVPGAHLAAQRTESSADINEHARFAPSYMFAVTGEPVDINEEQRKARNILQPDTISNFNTSDYAPRVTPIYAAPQQLPLVMPNTKLSVQRSISYSTPQPDQGRRGGYSPGARSDKVIEPPKVSLTTRTSASLIWSLDTSGIGASSITSSNTATHLTPTIQGVGTAISKAIKGIWNQNVDSSQILEMISNKNQSGYLEWKPSAAADYFKAFVVPNRSKAFKQSPEEFTLQFSSHLDKALLNVTREAKIGDALSAAYLDAVNNRDEPMDEAIYMLMSATQLVPKGDAKITDQQVREAFEKHHNLLKSISSAFVEAATNPEFGSTGARQTIKYGNMTLSRGQLAAMGAALVKLVNLSSSEYTFPIVSLMVTGKPWASPQAMTEEPGDGYKDILSGAGVADKNHDFIRALSKDKAKSRSFALHSIAGYFLDTISRYGSIR